jgi:hypothetical protein
MQGGLSFYGNMAYRLNNIYPPEYLKKFLIYQARRSMTIKTIHENL